MALVMSPWFGRGCARRARPFGFGFGSPSLFSDLVIIKVPVQQRQACAPPREAAMSNANARVVQWAETPDAHIFKLRLPGLKKEDLQIQVGDGDRTLYISYSNQQGQQAKEKTVKFKDDESANLEKEGEATSAPDSRRPEQNDAPTGRCSFMRKFKLPETADLEQVTADVADETLTVTVPKLKAPAPREPRRIEIQGATTTAPSQPKTGVAEKAGDAKASTSTA